jgi:hypothetical protein
MKYELMQYFIMGNCTSNANYVHNNNDNGKHKRTVTEGTVSSRHSDCRNMFKSDDVQDSVHVLLQHSIDDAKKHGTQVSGYRPSFDVSSIQTQSQSQHFQSINSKKTRKDDLDEQRHHYHQYAKFPIHMPTQQNSGPFPIKGTVITESSEFGSGQSSELQTEPTPPEFESGAMIVDGGCAAPTKLTMNDTVVLNDSIRRMLYHTSHHCDTIDPRDAVTTSDKKVLSYYQQQIIPAVKQQHRPQCYNQYPDPRHHHRMIIVSEEP